MNPTIKDLKMVRGDSAYIWITISGAVPEEVSFSVKRRYSDIQYVAHKSLTDGITLDDGKYVVCLAPEDTANLPATRYCYDTELIINGDVITPILGTLDLTPDVTNTGFVSAEREYSYTAATTDNVLLDISVDITQEPPEGVSFTVLKGDKGDPGHSPEVTASKTDGTTTISVDGEPIAEIIDGVDGHSPVVMASKTDGITTVYVDGNPIASITDGIDGHSPVVTASVSGKETTIYVDGTAVAVIYDGEDGEDGYSPTASVSKSGSTATISITDKDGTTTATVTDGEDGEDGYSPTATVSKTDGTATITITDKDGTTTAEVEDGYTPERGVDYWTESDKAEIIQEAGDGKADVIIRSASGDIVNITDGADNAPVERLTVNIEPVQDLHGYDNPWPAGGGKNLWPLDKAFSYTASKAFQFESPIMKANETYTISGTLDIDDDQYTSLVMFYAPESGGYTANVEITEGTFATTFSPTVDVYRLNFYATRIAATNPGVTASFDYFQIEKGSTATSYSPYSNICPITGWDRVKVTMAEKNLADISPENIYHESLCTRVFENGGLVITPTGNYGRVGITLNVKTGKQYTISMKAKATGNIVRIALSSDTNWHYKDYGVLVAGGGITPTLTDYRKTITALSDKVYLECYAGSSTLTIEDIQFELGTEATPYEPYQGDVYDISFGDAGTVYGGTLDVTTGELVVDKAITILSSAENYAVSAGTDRNRVTWNGYMSTGKTSGNFVADRLKAKPPTVGGYGTSDWEIWGSTAAPRCWISVPQTIATVSDFNAWLDENPIQLVYELAAPLTYHLTPTQIKTLLGENHIWADCGAVDVEYHSDTKKYIDGAISERYGEIATLRESIASVENGNTASKAYAAGAYFIRNGSFCKALTAIASGAQFTLNTNYVVTTVATELFTALNA